MVDLVKLKFECIVECDLRRVDDLGADLATDLLGSMFNDEDIIDWNYTGYEVFSDG